MRMIERLLLTSLLLLALVVGLRAATPDPAGPAGGAALLVGSSSTNIQSFFWILDPGKKEITLCKTTSTASMGPQYDFDCKRRPIPASD